MKYLTPELYATINEANENEADAAYEQWDAAGAAARARLRQIEGKLPPKMQQLCDTLCLHDAEIVSVDFSGGANGDRTPVALISVRQDNRLVCLVYDLYAEPKIATPVASAAFVRGSDQRQWLYDEIDVVDETTYRHEIPIRRPRPQRSAAR
jgi:hypothetical protein